MGDRIDYDPPFYLMMRAATATGFMVLASGEKKEMKEQYASHLAISPFAILVIWDSGDFKRWMGYEELFGEGVYG